MRKIDNGIRMINNGINFWSKNFNKNPLKNNNKIKNNTLVKKDRKELKTI
jgi:hypothetical protein